MAHLPSVPGENKLALKRVCGTCGAKGGKPCVRIMGAGKGKPLDVPHFGRIAVVRRAAEEKLQCCPTCKGTGRVPKPSTVPSVSP